MSLSINGPPPGLNSLMVSRAELGGDSTGRDQSLPPEAIPTPQAPHAPAETRRPEAADRGDEASVTVHVDLELAVVERTSFELRHTTIDLTDEGSPPASESISVVTTEKAARGVDFDGDGEVTMADAAYGRLPQMDGSRLQTLAGASLMAVELARLAYSRLDE